MWFIYAAAAAFVFGIRGILYHWTSQRPIDRNLMLFAVFLSGVIVSFILNLFFQQPWNSGAWVGVLMGVFSFVANASMYKGYAVGKASIIAIFTGLPPLVVVILAYVLWREALGPLQLIGFIIVILGILFIRYSNDLKLGKLQGLQWGVLTMLFFGLTDISSKQATLLSAETLPLLMAMFTSGMILFAASYLRGVATAPKPGSLLAVSDNAGETGGSIKRWSRMRTIAWGLFVGLTNSFGMILIIFAFRDGVTGIVSLIVALNLVLVLFYARFYLKEMISKREALGMLLALIGMIALRIGS